MSRDSPSPACGGGSGWGLALASLLLTSPALAQDGRSLFENRCASCHSVASDAPPMAGPNLRGVVGRRVGGAAGFDYSPVLEGAGRVGDTWDPARLRRYLEDPDEVYPGQWMGANGLRVEADRRVVVEYLGSTSARD